MQGSLPCVRRRSVVVGGRQACVASQCQCLAAEKLLGTTMLVPPTHSTTAQPPPPLAAKRRPRIMDHWPSASALSHHLTQGEPPTNHRLSSPCLLHGWAPSPGPGPCPRLPGSRQRPRLQPSCARDRARQHVPDVLDPTARCALSFFLPSSAAKHSQKGPLPGPLPPAPEE